jgi:16S rRNA (guanine527-N7)-methyltransferase
VTEREFRNRIRRHGKRAGVGIPDALASGLWAYFELLRRWNRKINLTGFGDLESEAAIDRLLVEALVASRHIPAGAAVIDVGSGNGSPAIPMKLADPSRSLVMVEAKARKSAFLREALRALDLQSTSVENARFEELLARPDLHEALDVVTARALRVDPKRLTSLQAFLKPGGRILLFRAGAPSADAGPAFPLVVEATHPLIPDYPSNHLMILVKRRL